ncbi:type II toxin-antitoxin system RelE/ParE family toxin [Microbacterium maritypicum]|nr:type II toxin-antitoxin system RelE/ParE family toxin [Microbacterium liquefaciens]
MSALLGGQHPVVGDRIGACSPGEPAIDEALGVGDVGVRVGDYRVIYDIEDDRLVVLVLAAGHRRGIYR